MSDAAPDQPDYRSTVFLPKTDFPMKAGLAQKEPAILARWQADDLYGKIRAARAGAERFILHDGPPYANGDIHIGHAMMKSIKDFILRSQTLLGKDAPFVPGWDCHGLPIEWKIEEAYRKKKQDKDQVPPKEFRAECRAYAAGWVETQSAQFQRLGVLGDWAHPYRTMDYASEAVIAGELLKFAMSGQLYRGAKPVMWSPVEKTALAEAEVEYEDITSTQIDVAFEIMDSPIKELIGAHAVIWTTTPWTIPVNQALAYGPEVEYSLIEVSLGDPSGYREGEPAPLMSERRFLVATQLLGSFTDRNQRILPQGEVIKTFLGRDLEGTRANHPMHHLGGFFAKPRPFLAGDFVTTDAGTGLVHMAPDHGEDDFELCKAHGIDPVFAVEGDGKYRADWAWPEDKSLSVINKKLLAPDGPICTDLQTVGALLSARNDESTRHSYPHSWRSKAPLIYRATPQWFIPMDAPLGERVSTALDTNAVVDEAATPTPVVPSEVEGHAPGATLRQTALSEIAKTRWVPARAENRIRSMVEGRPDWVISRQRAWGVPIALYLKTGTNQYLRDAAVNARILAAFEAGGADAWFGADHQALLGPDYDLADYTPVTDILDVWFDSGSTHAFVVEKRFGEGVRANLYCEGSDQHRGWFQSSLLESCGTRGRAPYDAVLTHGFVLDGQGRKMSKSVGNVIDPLKLIGESGADIVRLWAATSDYFDDIRIGKEILAGTGDAYRKLRNTFRYLLGALDGFDEGERVAPADMPELERWALHRLAVLDAELRQATADFEFSRYARAILSFANDDLSAFLFDIRKDSLYCDAPANPGRRAYRSLLDTLFEALVRWIAPLVPFTAEEVWASRYPDADSIHLATWPDIDAGWRDDALGVKWARLRAIRGVVTQAIEPLRREKVVGSSLEAEVTLLCYDPADKALVESVDFAEVAIVARIEPCDGDRGAASELGDVAVLSTDDVRAEPRKTDYEKCGRCWRHLPEVETEGALCARCEDVVGG